MARMFKPYDQSEKDDDEPFVQEYVLELDEEMHKWLFKKYGYCHDTRRSTQLLVVCYKISSIQNMQEYCTGHIEYFQCLWCGSTLQEGPKKRKWKPPQ